MDEIVEGIRHGVRKVNIDTDCRMAISGQVRKILLEKKTEFDPRKFTLPATAAMQEVCESRYESFGTAGNASKLKPLPLAAMAELYSSGELNQKII